MKKLNCKLIVSDFDGTLANSRNTVDEEVKAAINSYVNAGGIFAVCTGRILPSILPIVRGMGLKGLIIASQGSVIADVETGELLRNVCFTGGQTAEICAALEEVGTNVQIYCADGLYSDLPADEKHLKIYESIVGLTARHTDMPLSRFAAGSAQKFNKVATLCHPEEQRRLYSEIKERLGEKYDVTCSAKVLVEISPFGETKGNALKFLAAHYGVPMEKTCAIGDNLNDLSMIEEAGVGVAVGNGVPELKERADYVSVTNDEGAVARVIEKFGYIEND